MIFQIVEREITRIDDEKNPISFNSDYIAEFHFDDEWTGKIKTARFVQNGEYFDVVLVNDRCKIPPLKTGFIRVGVFTDSMTSTYADVYYKTSIKDGTGNPTEPPEDVYAQLTALIESGILRGEDGLTPYVGENNKWWIGDIDTGVLARGTDGYTPIKGVDYFTTEEVQQIQNEVSESIQANINHLEINKADKSELAKTNLSLDALWKMNRGQTYDVLEQESEAYSVDVPSGSRYASVDMVGGKSLVWNQMAVVDIELYSYTGDIAFTNNKDGSYTANGTTLEGASMCFPFNYFKTPHKFVAGHKYLIKGCPSGGSSNTYRLGLTKGGISLANDYGDGKLYTASSQDDGKTIGCAIYIYAGTTIDNLVFKPQIFDLTQMFGAGNEPSTVEEFKAMFPAEYYPYTEPTIISSQIDRVDVKSADGTITQQITTGFPVLNSAGSVYDYIDIDNGKLHQRVENVDLGSFDWDKFTYGESTVFRSYDYTGKKPSGSTHMANIICSDYESASASDLYSFNKDKAIAVHNGSVGLLINNSAYTDVESFKQAMSGVMLYYELAEEVITDIEIPSELAEWLEVEAGGSITFHNADEGKRLLIPNKLSFVRKLDEVTV